MRPTMVVYHLFILVQLNFLPNTSPTDSKLYLACPETICHSCKDTIQKPVITLKDQPTDSIFTYILNGQFPDPLTATPNDVNFQIIPGKSTLIEKNQMKAVYDSLTNKEISYSYHSVVYQVDLKKIHKEGRTRHFDYPYTSSSSRVLINSNEADTALDLYYVGRILDTENNKTEIEIIRLITKAPLPPFPADSIGSLYDTCSFAKIDTYVKTIRAIKDKELAARITKPYKNDIEKVWALFKWIQLNIKYDCTGVANGTLTVEVNDVLRKRIAVCEGYSRLFNWLCTGAGIRSERIRGLTPLGMHAWNAVCINNRWFLLDATWGTEYFLMKPEHFIKDHFPSIGRWTLLPQKITLQDWSSAYLPSVK